ncbi:MAG: M15 family metallopeptidase [Rikenellaceae bacterium]|nr:M15 family metallopeptidase [Rikenellaceae bacterium]
MKVPEVIVHFFVLLIFTSCLGRTGGAATEIEKITDYGVPHTPTTESIPPKSLTELMLDSLGLVDISQVDGRIAVDLVYSTPDNFLGEVLYDDLTRAYLVPDAAAKLVKAQDILDSLRPGFRIVVYDAARPMSVQRKMRKFAEVHGKHYYVADPSKGGGLHNYGAAVDISLLDDDNNPLPMGTGYDHLGFEANIDNEQSLVERGIITRDELANRLLLRKIMREAGFTTVQSEWWHFNHVSRQEARQKYYLIDF